MTPINLYSIIFLMNHFPYASLLQDFQSDTLLNREHYKVHKKTNPSRPMKTTSYRPHELTKPRRSFNIYITCYVLCNSFMRCYIHHKVSVVAAGDLAPRWHQNICNHHDDIGGWCVLGVIINSCSLEHLTIHSRF